MYLFVCVGTSTTTALFQVLVSGPSGMVDTVMAESRKISWRVFDVESASREF